MRRVTESRDLPEGVQDSAAGLLARDGLILEQRRVGLFLEWCVESSDGDDESRGFLYGGAVRQSLVCRWTDGVPCATRGRCSNSV
jgi:hypothetical protein